MILKISIPVLVIPTVWALPIRREQDTDEGPSRDPRFKVERCSVRARRPA